ncbi:MAG: hypothetical protein RJA22_1257 [Verrucomicrobiota bacterium]|jgi:hypothetical protein
MLLRLVFFHALAFSLAMAGTGCSGINTSHGVSPATFLIPGFFGQAPAPGHGPVPLPPPAAEPASVTHPS